MVARHFMYKQVYLHPIRRVYDIHLKDFLKSWLPGHKFSIDLKKHFRITDAEVLAAIRREFAASKSSKHTLARRIQCREHFRMFYSASPSDKAGGKLRPGKIIADAAEEKFGKDWIRYDYIPPKVSAPDFPVRRYDGKIESSMKLSAVLEKLPVIEVETVYCDKSISAEAERWRKASAPGLLGLG